MLNFDYTPLSEEEAQRKRFQLLDDGIYDAVIDKAISKMSASNNAMGEIHLSVFDKNGHPAPVRDYVMFSPNMIWKTRHLCDAAALQKEFDEGKFRPEMAENKRVRVLVGTQKGKEIPFEKLNGKPVGSLYPDKNIIHDYVPFDPSANDAVTKDVFNDDIPF
jgi:hypothetical protein